MRSLALYVAKKSFAVKVVMVGEEKRKWFFSFLDDDVAEGCGARHTKHRDDEARTSKGEGITTVLSVSYTYDLS
jgi:hypothetical protein